MSSLRTRDLQRVLDAAAEVAAATTLPELQHSAARVAAELMPADRTGWIQIDRRGRRMRGIHWPRPIPRLLERLPMDIAEIPLVVPQLQAPGPISLRISDVFSRREWHAQRIWAELYGPEGTEHQIGSAISRRPEALHAMSWTRPDRDFSEREVEIAELFTRHVRVAADRIGPVMEEDPGLGLTARQREALRALERGATVREAAARLGIAEKTLENHLQEAYRRLGVTNRTAALRILRGGRP